MYNKEEIVIVSIFDIITYERGSHMPIITFLVYVFVTSFTPGPNNILAMSYANHSGLKKTIRFCLGVGAGFFVIVILSCYFNLLLKSIIPKIEFVMQILGAIYMVYLAVKILKSKNSDKKTDGDSNNRFITGMLLQFINPKGILYGLTVVSTFILPYHTSNISFIIFSCLLALVGVMSTLSWSVFGSVFQTFLSNYRTPFNIVMALLLVYTAISILME